MSKSIGIRHTHTRKKIVFPYEIAVFCFKKPEIVLTNTLLLLRSYGVPTSKITLFVETKEKEGAFQKIFSYKAYGRLLVVGEKGMTAMSNFVQSIYPNETMLVCMQEDCTGFLEYYTYAPQKTRQLKSLIGLIQTGFEMCRKMEATMWGLYPHAEPGFLQSTLTTGLAYNAPQFWGTLILPRHSLTLDSCIHHERILQVYSRDRCILRFNQWAVMTSESESNTNTICLEEAKQLADLYPDYCTIDDMKSSFRLRLYDKTKDSGEIKRGDS